jgi:hypothetical protein
MKYPIIKQAVDAVLVEFDEYEWSEHFDVNEVDVVSGKRVIIPFPKYFYIYLKTVGCPEGRVKLEPHQRGIGCLENLVVETTEHTLTTKILILMGHLDDVAQHIEGD